MRSTRAAGIAQVLYELYQLLIHAAMVVVVGAIIVHSAPTGVGHVVGFVVIGIACLYVIRRVFGYLLCGHADRCALRRLRAMFQKSNLSV